MPTLDWSESSQAGISHEREQPDGSKHKLALELERDQVQELVTVLQASFRLDQPRELRLELVSSTQDRWTLYWKLKEGTSRCLVAHPEDKTWVATLAVAIDLYGILLEALKALGAQNGSIDLDQILKVDRSSNIAIELRAR